MWPNRNMKENWFQDICLDMQILDHFSWLQLNDIQVETGGIHYLKNQITCIYNYWLSKIQVNPKNTYFKMQDIYSLSICLSLSLKRSLTRKYYLNGHKTHAIMGIKFLWVGYFQTCYQCIRANTDVSIYKSEICLAFPQRIAIIRQIWAQFRYRNPPKADKCCRQAIAILDLFMYKYQLSRV